MDTDPHNGVDKCQQFQTDQGSPLDDFVLLFPLDDGVSRHLATTARQQSRVDPLDGQNPIDPVYWQTHTHWYNTRFKSKVENVMQEGDLLGKSHRVAIKKFDRYASGLSHTPTGLLKKSLADPDTGPILQWKESVTRPIAPEVCTASAATRHYQNPWDMLQIKNGVSMRCFVRHDAGGGHLQFLVPKTMHTEILQHIHNFLLGGCLGQKIIRESEILLEWNMGRLQ